MGFSIARWFSLYARARLAVWRAARPEPAGLEGLFTEPEPECPIPVPDCPSCRSDPLAVVSSLDPVEVGRQRLWTAAVNDTVAWLEASGWSGTPTGDLQCYAAWLLERRDAYERQGAPT